MLSVLQHERELETQLLTSSSCALLVDCFLLQESVKPGGENSRKLKKNHPLCQNLLSLWGSVCCLLSWDCLQRVHRIFKKQSEKAGSTLLLQSTAILTLQTVVMGFPGAWCYIICHDVSCKCPWTSCLTILHSLFLALQWEYMSSRSYTEPTIHYFHKEGIFSRKCDIHYYAG